MVMGTVYLRARNFKRDRKFIQTFGMGEGSKIQEMIPWKKRIGILKRFCEM